MSAQFQVKLGIADLLFSIRFLVPQVGGDLPATLDRTLGYLVGFLRQPPSTIDYVYDVIRNRFFYESAGPSYPHQ